MKFEVGQFAELFSTFCACVRFLSSVNKHVISEVALLVETFVADPANKIFLIGVNLHVSLQGGRPVESFVAVFTLVRLLFGMDDLVTAQCAGQTEPFATHTTNKRPVLGVIGHPQMNGKCVLGFKHFMTLLTLVFGRVEGVGGVFKGVA